MLSFVYEHVQQLFNFTESLGVAENTAELVERDYLVVLFEVSCVACHSPDYTICTYLQYCTLPSLADS